MYADLLEVLEPVLSVLAGVDVSDPGAAARLSEELPLSGPALQRVEAVVRRGLSEGWLCPRESGGVRFGRAARASAETGGFSIDVVDMSGPGPGHSHPNGEVDLCFALEGEPTFDGQPPGWTVYPGGSWHVPTVSGGRMGILYFLPEGAIRFEARPAV